MKPPPFSYHDPESVDEVTALLARLDNAKVLAGGQSLMPMLNMRFVMPDHVIDLNRVAGLAGIREVDGALEIGAMTRQRDIEFSDVVRRRCPLLAEAIAQVGHRQTRNRGTIGGSLCHLDPAAEMVTVAAALDASVRVVGSRGAREIRFRDFPAGYMSPALEADELLVSVRLPDWAPGHGHAFVEFARRHGDFAITSAAVLLEGDGAGRIARASVTLGGIGPAPVRVGAVEQELVGKAGTPALFAEVAASCRTLEAMEDVHAPASYRQHLAVVLTRRALATAFERMGA